MKFKILIIILILCCLIPIFYKKERTIADTFIHDKTNDLPKLNDYQKINEEVVMLLKFNEEEKTHLIPVVYKESGSDYYFRKSIYDEYDSMGTAFIDNQCTPKSQNLIINGHSSKTKNIQFTFLESYKNKDYFDSHPSFSIITENSISEYLVISFAEYDLTAQCYTGWYNASFKTDKDMRNMLKMTEPYCIQKADTAILTDSLVTLITCNMDKENSRYVLMAVKK